VAMHANRAREKICVVQVIVGAVDAYCFLFLIFLKTARVGWQFVEVPTGKGNHRKSPSNVEAS